MLKQFDPEESTCQTPQDWAQRESIRLWFKFDESLQPMGKLAALSLAVETLEFRKAFAVREAREAGKTWQEIGDVAGMSRQGAQQRWSYVDGMDRA